MQLGCSPTSKETILLDIVDQDTPKQKWIILCARSRSPGLADARAALPVS